jgi:predicted nucleic acid-binding protein
VSVFVDTSAVLALIDAQDPRQALVQATWHDLKSRDVALVTTNYVVVETASLVQRRFGVGPAQLYFEKMVPALGVYFVDSHLHGVAVGAWMAASNRDLSLVDVVSFAAMRQLGVRQAFALDPHFAERGFECLPRGWA